MLMTLTDDQQSGILPYIFENKRSYNAVGPSKHYDKIDKSIYLVSY
jgi:hypothetical protein